jgi:hypothetical protein
MQTFLPYPDFVDSAKCLDNKRLGKQRVECWQILRALKGETKGWINHPATQMWKGYETALKLYAQFICSEWHYVRGFKDTMLQRFHIKLISNKERETLVMPPWLGEEKFHASHRSNLLRKDPKWYGQFGWSEPDDLPYVWPTKDLEL